MIQITINGVRRSTAARTLHELRTQLPACDVIVYNGFQTDDDYPLSDGDTVVLLKKGVLPSEDVLETMLSARHSPGVYQKIHNGKVAVAGLGGLGSHIAAALARTGVGELLLVDYDVVEPTNLNRQHYSICHLGMYKTDALKEQLAQINPYVRVLTKTVRVNEKNAYALFREYPIVCEAFDHSDDKAMLVSALLERTKDIKIIAASGMAGYGSANQIVTKRKMKQLYLCGDGETEAKPLYGLMAPRVQVCAGHQASMALRLILGIEEV